MAEEEVTRRLAAIMSADMVAYSRLMETDERGTIDRQKAHRQELIDPTIADFHGRIVKTTGDGMLVEFPSVVEAVDCAMTIQQAMGAREDGVADERRIQYRIGINLGDIVIDGDDIFGDGVNIAARLEGLADPGGVCISRAARDQIRDKLDYTLDDLGEIEVKNIARPVRAFRVLREGEAATGPRREAGGWRKFAVAAVVLLVVAIGGGYWWWHQPDFEPADPTQYAFKLPEKPSIAVLPFDNLTGDKAQDYIGDGLSESIIAALATEPRLFVIARNSSFTYKGKATKVQQVAEELGVKYVLEGSVQRSGERIRVTAQLVNALDGKHIWSERYDRESIDLFKVHDEIIGEIFLGVGFELTRGERVNWEREISGDFESYRLYIQGLGQFHTWSKKGHKAAENMWSALLRRKPNTFIANHRMGWIHWQKMSMGISKDRKKDFALARQYAEKSIAIKQNPNAYVLLASLDTFKRKHNSAIKNIDRALELAPANPPANITGGWIKTASGQPTEGVELFKLGMRYDPYYPTYAAYSLVFGLMHLGKHDEAKKIAEGLLASKDVADVRTHPAALRLLTAIAVFQDDLDMARGYANSLMELKPEFSISKFKRRVAYYKNKTFTTRYLDALRKAGLPENPPLKLPSKPSIAVLPFDNLSGDKDQEFLADGLSETITSALAMIPELFVIARNSSFTYKGKATKVQQIARELGVRYVLEGSLQKAGDSLRVTAQLIDAANGHHLWSDRYDRKSTDLFALQDDIALRIMSALQVELTDGEKARLSVGGTTSLRAWGLAVKGRAAFLKFKQTDNARARNLFQQAIDLDPKFIWGWRGIGWTHALDARRLWGESYDVSLRLAKEATSRAFEINPNDSEVHALLGNIHMLQGEFDAAIANGKKAIALAPNIADNYGVLAMTTHYVGDFKETIALSKKAMRLHPIHPAWYLYRLGNTQMLAGDYKNAIPTIKEYLKRNRTIRGELGLATAYSMAGQTEKAKEIVKKLLVEKPSLSLKYAEKIHRFKDTKHLDRVLSALRDAGVPEAAPTN